MCSLSELVIRASHADRFYLLFLRFPSCLRRSCEFFTEYLSGVETETDTFCSCLLFRVEWQSVGDEDISQTPDCRGENRRFRTRWGGCRPPRCWGGQDHLKIPLRPHPNYGPIFNPPPLYLSTTAVDNSTTSSTQSDSLLSLSPLEMSSSSSSGIIFIFFPPSLVLSNAIHAAAFIHNTLERNENRKETKKITQYI